MPQVCVWGCWEESVLNEMQVAFERHADAQSAIESTTKDGLKSPPLAIVAATGGRNASRGDDEA